MNSFFQYFFIGSAVLIFLIVMAVTGSRSPQWEKSYETTLMSKHEALEISREVFDLLIKKGIKSKREGLPPKCYLLRLFGGNPGAKFTDYFRRRGEPKILHGSNFSRGDYINWGLIHVEKFEHFSASKLAVDVSIKFYGNNKKMKVIYEKKNNTWKLINIIKESSKTIRD